MKKIDETGGVTRKEGSGQPKSICRKESIKLVKEMIISQVYQPETHSTPAEIARELNIDRRWVSSIIDQDLDLRLPRKRKVHKLTDSKLLSSYTQKTLQITFFSDKNLFKVKQLYNSHDYMVNIPKKMMKAGVPEERLFCETKAFLKQIMLSVGVSKAGKTSIFLLNQMQR